VPVRRTVAVFFDVDFTLIHPGRRFQGEGYAESCARHGVAVDAARFDAAVAAAASILDSPDQLYDDALFVRYTQKIIEEMGGSGDVEAAAREIYEDWASHDHFELYEDVPGALRGLSAAGFRLGLISNSHRPLETFEEHFELSGLISVRVSSSDHGYLKPHPSIFRAALDAMRVEASQAAMVGDSFLHDVVGARQVGMQGILIARQTTLLESIDASDVPVIRTLTELPALLEPRVVAAPMEPRVVDAPMEPRVFRPGDQK
jgi:putative hydrolase of the HAD superfamily